MSKTKMMTALALVLAASGCLADDPALGEDSANLSSPGLHGMIADTDTAVAIAGNRATQCFLATVEGDISAGIGQLGGAGAGVHRVDGHWEMWARPSSGGVHVEAMCADVITVPVDYEWTSGSATTQMKSTTGWRCLLTEVSTAPTQFASGGLHSDTDAVQITSSGGFWRLGGSTTGTVTAKARCIEYTNDYGQLSVSAPANQTATVNTSIFDNGVGCALTAITGHFDAEARGVDTNRAQLPSTSAYLWSLTATDSAGGTFRCIR